MTIPASTPSPAYALQLAYNTLYASSIAAQLQAQTLIQQPYASLDAVPTLQMDVLAAQANARTALGATEPDVLRTVASGIGYCNLQMSMHEQLAALAVAIDLGGDAGAAARVQFISGLNLLAGQIRMLQPGLDKLSQSASQLQIDTQASATTLATDAANASTDPQVVALQAQVQTVLNALAADCTIIASSMKGTGVGEIKLGIAMYNMEDKSVAAVKAFVGFILDTAKKDEGVQVALADEQAQLKLLAPLYHQLEQLESTVAVVQTLSATAYQLSSAANNLAGASTQLDAAWQLLADNFANAITSLSGGCSSTEPLAPQMAAQQALWTELSAGLKAWQLQGTAAFKFVSFSA